MENAHYLEADEVGEDRQSWFMEQFSGMEESKRNEASGAVFGTSWKYWFLNSLWERAVLYPEKE